MHVVNATLRVCTLHRGWGARAYARAGCEPSPGIFHYLLLLFALMQTLRYRSAISRRCRWSASVHGRRTPEWTCLIVIFFCSLLHVEFRLSDCHSVLGELRLPGMSARILIELFLLNYCHCTFCMFFLNLCVAIIPFSIFPLACRLVNLPLLNVSFVHFDSIPCMLSLVEINSVNIIQRNPLTYCVGSSVHH